MGWRGVLPTSVALVLLLAAPGCERARPTPVEDPQLGFRAVFPGNPRKTRYAEPTPFSDRAAIDWFGYIYTPAGRMDEQFHAVAGNLPEGARPGDAIPAPSEGGGGRVLGTMSQRRILEVFEGFLRQRLGPIQREDLPATRGFGFRYTAPDRSGTYREGVLILRGGRLHHAQATVRRREDPRLRTFLDGFALLPGA